jgi:hypothetical protein
MGLRPDIQPTRIYGPCTDLAADISARCAVPYARHLSAYDMIAEGVLPGAALVARDHERPVVCSRSAYAAHFPLLLSLSPSIKPMRIFTREGVNSEPLYVTDTYT